MKTLLGEAEWTTWELEICAGKLFWGDFPRFLSFMVGFQYRFLDENRNPVR